MRPNVALKMRIAVKPFVAQIAKMSLLFGMFVHSMSFSLTLVGENCVAKLARELWLFLPWWFFSVDLSNVAHAVIISSKFALTNVTLISTLHRMCDQVAFKGTWVGKLFVTKLALPI